MAVARRGGDSAHRRGAIVSGSTAPHAWPILGHVPVYLRDRLGFLSRAARDAGPVVRLLLGGETYLLNDVRDVQHVLVERDDNYVKSPRMLGARARKWTGDVLLTASGSSHLRRRRALQPAFHTGAVERYRDDVVEAVEEWLSRRRDGEVIDVADEMLRLTHRMTGRILMSADFGDSDAALGQAVIDRRRFIRHVFFSSLPSPERWPLPVVRRHRRARATLRREIMERIAARRRLPDPPPDLLTMLISARSRDGWQLSDEEIVDETVTLAVTGWETVGEALSWIWHLVGSHPAAAARMREEIDTRLGGRAPDVKDLPALSYVAMVREESLRLYPPTWIWVRVAQGPDSLPSGTAIEAGTKLYLCPWIMHRDPRHFPDPERFDPDRFAEVAAGGRPPAAFFPFGKGPHVCIGEHLARMEIALAMTRIAQRIELLPVPGPPVLPDPGITLTPRGGLPMRVRSRPAAA